MSDSAPGAPGVATRDRWGSGFQRLQSGGGKLISGAVVAHSFFERVYHVVRQIPWGRVATYGQIARLLGEPHAARSVGWAMRASGDPDVPWHRVVNAQGRISAAERRIESGLQRALLEEEGVVFDEHGRVDLDVFRWEAPPDAADGPTSK